VFAPRLCYSIPLPTGRALELGARTLVMGVLNVTPDSFAETARLVSGGAVDVGLAVETALRLESEGADIIDVGGESTRPGADTLSAGEELARVVPVVRALVDRVHVPVSVDTYKESVARAALDAGAAIVNDVSGLQYEPALAGVVAAARALLVLMHTRGRSKGMYDEAVYRDLAPEIVSELRRSLAVAERAGVPIERVIVDPGIGFAKRAEHSYGVLARLPDIAAAFGRPILVGPSRKSYLREALGGRPADQRDWGTAAAVTAAVLGGAHIVRVHAVAEMTQVARVADEIRRAEAGEPTR
jgi:dihydropteroate synthase